MLTPIIPVMCGESSTAKAMTHALGDEGVMAGAIVFPMVARDKARIRTQMSAGLTRNDLDAVLRCFEKVGPQVGVIEMLGLKCVNDFEHLRVFADHLLGFNGLLGFRLQPDEGVFSVFDHAQQPPSWSPRQMDVHGSWKQQQRPHQHGGNTHQTPRSTVSNARPTKGIG